MKARVSRDDDLLRTAEEFTGITDNSALLLEALEVLIHREASRQLASLGGTMPNLEAAPRLRVEDKE